MLSLLRRLARVAEDSGKRSASRYVLEPAVGSLVRIVPSPRELHSRQAWLDGIVVSERRQEPPPLPPTYGLNNDLVENLPDPETTCRETPFSRNALVEQRPCRATPVSSNARVVSQARSDRSACGSASLTALLIDGDQSGQTTFNLSHVIHDLPR